MGVAWCEGPPSDTWDTSELLFWKLQRKHMETRVRSAMVRRTVRRRASVNLGTQARNLGIPDDLQGSGRGNQNVVFDDFI